MNRNKILSLLLLIACIWVCECIASEGYEILFRGVTSQLTSEEQKQIFQQLEFCLSDNGKFYTDYCDDRDVSPAVEVVDLNGDGVDEVFVYWGNFGTSGNAERSISLFIKDSFGRYVMNLGFPAISYRILAAKNQGFPDLEFGGPGFCRGVWQWNGHKYEYECSREEEPGACVRQGVKTLCECTPQEQIAEPPGTTSPQGVLKPEVQSQMPVKILTGMLITSSPTFLEIRAAGEESSTPISVRIGLKTKYIPFRRPAVGETVEVEYQDENGDKFGYEVRVVDVSPRATSPEGPAKPDVQSQMPVKQVTGEEPGTQATLTEQLIEAVQHEDVALAKTLLNRGADANAEGWEQKPLILAARSGHLELVKLLLDKGADANEKLEDSGMTALAYAAGGRHWEVVKLLLDKGANVGWVLMAAAGDGNLEMAKLLLDKGADVNVEDEGETPLINAVTKGHLEMAKLLLDKGADVDAPHDAPEVTIDNHGPKHVQPGKTALMTAVEYGNLEIAKLLLDKGADVNATNTGGETPLIKGVGEGHLEMVKLILDRGADANLKNYRGATAR